ncbi:MAG: hypothetical protein ACE5HA_17670 [Anaerolineae bacterium]
MSDLTGVVDAPLPAGGPSSLVAEPNAGTVEPMIGPGAPSGLRCCILCLGAFQAGETWLRPVPADGGYAIGVHVGCYHAGAPPVA